MNVEIAQRLAELRRERGFSQEGLAEQLGLSRQAVSKWERAESAPDMGNLIALADLYEVTLDELLRVSPEVEEDMRFESQERAESVETEAVAAAEAALAAAARAEAAAATAVEAPEAPKVVVEVSAPAAAPSGFPPAVAAPGHVGPGQGAPHGFAPPPQMPGANYRGPSGAPQVPPTIPPAASVPIAPPPPPRPKDPLQSFPYPLLCAVIFLLAGFCFGWWHPAWVIFLTIPFYYWVVNTLEADPAYRAWVDERRSGTPTTTVVPFSAGGNVATGAPTPFTVEEPANGPAHSTDDAADADSPSEGGAR